MTRHTKGPWLAASYSMSNEVRGSFSVTFFASHVVSGILELEENAKVAQAAPELLEALETIKRRMYEPRQFMLQDVEAIIDIAIARVKGT